ncbi:MAG: MaoC/PaaZ C-terminal domain-containing protein [Thermodesulfobacteriota bacterium]|nr:MaoC/PaaZ C-terminal domain-containing protein [Thermodesulfobacteriota bacterium]
MERERYWDDFNLGDKFTTPGMTVTETHVVIFAGLVGDLHPNHTNEEVSKKGPFGGRIVHGTLTFSIATGLGDRSGIYKDSVLAWLGTDNLKALAPVKMGDTIYVEIVVKAKKETKKPERGIITLEYIILNQRNEKVMTFDFTLMMHKKA